MGRGQHLRECGLVADPYGPIREENVLFCLEGTDKVPRARRGTGVDLHADPREGSTG